MRPLAFATRPLEEVRSAAGPRHCNWLETHIVAAPCGASAVLKEHLSRARPTGFTPRGGAPGLSVMQQTQLLGPQPWPQALPQLLLPPPAVAAAGAPIPPPPPPLAALQAFVRRRNVQLVRNDAAWAVFWLM